MIKNKFELLFYLEEHDFTIDMFRPLYDGRSWRTPISFEMGIIDKGKPRRTLLQIMNILEEFDFNIETIRKRKNEVRQLDPDPQYYIYLTQHRDPVKRNPAKKVAKVKEVRKTSPVKKKPKI
jgi:hypothetical protein